jgi:hypothetical protein
METRPRRPEIGQWYTHRDKGEVFQVVGFDDRSQTVEIQSFDGDVDEIDAEKWQSLVLERCEPPEDWTGPMDDIEKDDLGYSETEMKPADWTQPLQALQPGTEAWEETEAEEERDVLGEGQPREPLSADLPETEVQER